MHVKYASAQFQTLGGKAIELTNLTSQSLIFDSNIYIDTKVAYVFDKCCWYDIIFGANFLYKISVAINYNISVLQWVNQKVSLKDTNEFFDIKIFVGFNENYANKNKTALSTKRSLSTMQVVADDDNQTLLNVMLTTSLGQIQYKLFDWYLGVYSHQKVHIEILPG